MDNLIFYLNAGIRGMIKKLSIQYALVRFIALNSLLEMKDIGSVKSMQSCLVACVKHF